MADRGDYDAAVCSSCRSAGGYSAQEIDFGKIDKFESLGSGTLHVGAPPMTIVDDGERHVVVLTIWDADVETKVYWRSPDGNAPAPPSFSDGASKHSKS